MVAWFVGKTHVFGKIHFSACGGAEMGLARLDGTTSRFSAYVERLASVIGHADRAKPLRDYCMGLVMPCERKSVEPMAAITAPERTAAQHQSLLHFVGEGNWSDDKVLAEVRGMVLPEIERHGPIEAWIIDDTGFPKKGRHSVGVARQYCGEIGKQDNCQIAVTLSIANRHASLPVAYAFICQRSGQRTLHVDTKPGCRRRSLSKPSRPSRLSNCAGPLQRACRVAWC
jgi:SRSO17 transposase